MVIANTSHAPLRPLTESVKQPRITSSELFKNQTALYIEHGNEMYVLRITKQGKLILTK
jgi:hemin uptake protein HemP